MVFLFQKFSKQKSICIFVYLYICLLACPHPLGPNELDHLSRPQTRIEALNGYTTRPTGANLSPNTGTMACRWISRRMENPSDYPRELMAVYDADTDGKVNTLAAQLANADYIILSTRRMWAHCRVSRKISRDQPLYTLLLSGQLGYKEVPLHEATRRCLGLLSMMMRPKKVSRSLTTRQREYSKTPRVSKEEVRKKSFCPQWRYLERTNRASFMLDGKLTACPISTPRSQLPRPKPAFHIPYNFLSSEGTIFFQEYQRDCTPTVRRFASPLGCPKLASQGLALRSKECGKIP